jgi:hypothetical protein
MSLSVMSEGRSSLHDQNRMVQAIRCVVHPKSALYISGPITTGRIFIDWYLRDGMNFRANTLAYQSAMRSQVIKKNEAEILRLADEFRQGCNSPVIEPASLFIAEWSQLEYIGFWINVLGQFVREVILVDGWQYSAGCVAEYTYAKNNGYCIRGSDGAVMLPETGATLIIKAADEIEELAGKDEILQTLAAGLRKAVLEK